MNPTKRGIHHFVIMGKTFGYGHQTYLMPYIKLLYYASVFAYLKSPPGLLIQFLKHNVPFDILYYIIIFARGMKI
jgi:hypothetical protein